MASTEAACPSVSALRLTRDVTGPTVTRQVGRDHARPDEKANTHFAPFSVTDQTDHLPGQQDVFLVIRITLSREVLGLRDSSGLERSGQCVSIGSRQVTENPPVPFKAAYALHV